MPEFSYEREPLDEHEDVLGVFYGGRGKVGQQLIVTNRRLLFGPLDTGLAQDILGYGLDKGGIPGVDLVKKVLERYAPMNPLTLWLRHVVDVQATNPPSLLRAPGLRIITATGETIDFRVVKTPTTRNGHPDNAIIRDQTVHIIREAAKSARGLAN